MKPIEKVFALVDGGRAALAKQFSVSIQAVSKWQTRVPAGVVIGLAESVQFQVTPHQLRPDLYPHPDDGLPPELRGKPLLLETTDAAGEPRLEAVPQPVQVAA